MKKRLLSLCSGIGGIDYAWSHLLGQEIAGQVENDPYCQAVLQKQWPDVVKRADIREVHGDEFGPIDLVAGGVPCQPFSVSGQRRGTDDDRHLWPAAFAIIERCQPTWVLIENVVGFISLALDLVQTDLESAGYTSQAYVLPACAVGAPHTENVSSSWPTPLAGDGEHGGPNARDSKGRYSLTGRVHHIWPTPVALDAGSGRVNRSLSPTCNRTPNTWR